MKKHKICLILRNNPGWKGGSEYIKNILFSFSYLRAHDRKKVELHLINFDNSIDTINFHKYCDYLHSYSDLKSSILRKFFHMKKFLKLKEFIFSLIIIYKQKINFVFPFPNFLSLIGVNSALWIPDFQHHHFGKFFSNKEVRYRNKKFKKILQSTNNIVLSSKDCKKDLRKFYGFFNKRIYVLNFRAFLNKKWLKKNPDFIIEKYNLPEKFFLISNQFWRHKNHLLVFKALHYLKCEKNIYPNIVFTGKLFNRDEKFANLIIENIYKYKINDQIFLLDVIPKENQFLLMRKCIAIIQPSLFEGWSTIVEECRSIGKKVILSDLKVHKEQNYCHSIFFKRNSFKDLAKKIYQSLDHLEPGPDLIMEDLFAKENKVLMREFAEQFIELSVLN